MKKWMVKKSAGVYVARWLPEGALRPRGAVTEEELADATSDVSVAESANDRFDRFDRFEEQLADLSARLETLQRSGER